MGCVILIIVLAFERRASRTLEGYCCRRDSRANLPSNTFRHLLPLRQVLCSGRQSSAGSPPHRHHRSWSDRVEYGFPDHAVPHLRLPRSMRKLRASFQSDSDSSQLNSWTNQFGATMAAIAHFGAVVGMVAFFEFLVSAHEPGEARLICCSGSLSFGTPRTRCWVSLRLSACSDVSSRSSLPPSYPENSSMTRRTALGGLLVVLS